MITIDGFVEVVLGTVKQAQVEVRTRVCGIQGDGFFESLDCLGGFIKPHADHPEKHPRPGIVGLRLDELLSISLSFPESTRAKTLFDL